MTSPWDNVPALMSNMLDPVLLRRALKDRIQAAYAELYAQRGRVDTPEDTYAMQRRLAATAEQCKAYAQAFTDARKLLAQLQEEELVEAVGEQDGIPLGGLTVPHTDGDIRISLDAPAVYDIDVDQLVAAYVAAMVDGMHLNHGEWPELIATAITSTVEWIQTIGKFEPQVSKVKAFAATLAREGRDREASVVSGAITQRNPYKGVKFERAKPK